MSIILIIEILTVQEAIDRAGSKSAFALKVGIPQQNVNRVIDSKLVAVNKRGEYAFVKNEGFWHE
jgi:hypothetical protein